MNKYGDNWKLIKQIENQGRKNINELLFSMDIITPEQQRQPQPGTPDYDKMKESRVPRRYLQNKDGLRVYLPNNHKNVAELFFKAVDQVANISPRDKEEIAKK